MYLQYDILFLLYNYKEKLFIINICLCAGRASEIEYKNPPSFCDFCNNY